MLVISSNRNLSPRPIPTDPLLNYHLQDAAAAAAAVAPWVYSSLTSVSPPFSSAYSFGGEDLSPQASSHSTSSSSPPAICPGLSSSSSYSITPLPTAEFGGVMHPNSDEDSSADEDALCTEPAQQQQQQQQPPHSHHLSHPTASSSVKRPSSRQLYVHPATAGVSSPYPSFTRGLQDSTPSDFGHGSPQAPYLDDPRKLTDLSTQTHADAHSAHPDQYHHHLLSSGPSTAAAPNSLPTPPALHSTSGYEKTFSSPTVTSHDYKAYHSHSDSSNLIEQKTVNPTTQSLDLNILNDVRLKIEVKNWEEEKSMYFQIESKGIYVGRVQKTNLVNGTKLLNLTGISRGKRDGILKNEKIRKVVKHGTMHLKGVWISFQRALELADKYQIHDIVYPLLLPDLDRYVHVLQSPPSGSKGPETALHHASKFGNVPQSFLSRPPPNQYPVDQQSAWASSSHTYQEPYSAPAQSAGRGSAYEQAQFGYLNPNVPSSSQDLSERRHTVPNSYNVFQNPFPGQSLAYPLPYGSGQFSSYAQSSRPTQPVTNSPGQFAYNLANPPSVASCGSTYNYPNANTSSVYGLAPGPSTSSGTNQSSSPGLHNAPIPNSPPLHSPVALEGTSYGSYGRGQIGTLKREADCEMSSNSPEPSHATFQRRVQARILPDPSGPSFRQTATPGPPRYADWTGSAGGAAHQMPLGVDPSNSPTHSSAIPQPPPRSVSVTNSSTHSGRPGTDESHPGLVPLVNMPIPAPGASSEPSAPAYGSAGATSRPNRM